MLRRVKASPGWPLMMLFTGLLFGSRIASAVDGAPPNGEISANDGSPKVYNDPRMTEILAAFARREKLVDTGRFVWKQTHRILPGGLPTLDGRALPTATIESTNTGLEFQFDRERALSRSYVQFYNSTERGAAADDPANLHSFNGEEVASYFPPRDGDFGNLGIIHSAQEFRDYSNFDLWPFLFACRMLSPKGINLAGGYASILSPESQENSTSSSSPVVDLVWWGDRTHRILSLDATHDYRVVRFREFLNSTNSVPESGVLYAEIAIDAYDSARLKEGTAGALDIPTKWKIDRFLFDGSPSTVTFCELTDFELNTPYSKADFTITPFPVGAEVTDEPRKSRGIVRANGDLDPRGLKTRPPAGVAAAPLEGGGASVWPALLIGLNLALFLVVAGFVMFRRQLAKQSRK